MLQFTSRLSLSPLYSSSRTVTSTTRERERSKYMSNDLVPSNRVSSSFAHTHTHPINTANRGEFVTFSISVSVRVSGRVRVSNYYSSDLRY